MYAELLLELGFAGIGLCFAAHLAARSRQDLREQFARQASMLAALSVALLLAATIAPVAGTVHLDYHHPAVTFAHRLQDLVSSSVSPF